MPKTFPSKSGRFLFKKKKVNKNFSNLNEEGENTTVVVVVVVFVQRNWNKHDLSWAKPRRWWLLGLHIRRRYDYNFFFHYFYRFLYIKYVLCEEVYFVQHVCTFFSPLLCLTLINNYPYIDFAYNPKKYQVYYKARRLYSHRCYKRESALDSNIFGWQGLVTKHYVCNIYLHIEKEKFNHENYCLFLRSKR